MSTTLGKLEIGGGGAKASAGALVEGEVAGAHEGELGGAHEGELGGAHQGELGGAHQGEPGGAHEGEPAGPREGEATPDAPANGTPNVLTTSPSANPPPPPHPPPPCDVVLHVGTSLRLLPADPHQPPTTDDPSAFALARLVPGGLLCVDVAPGEQAQSSSALATRFPADVWNVEGATWTRLPHDAGPTDTRFLVTLRRRGARCNVRACRFKARTAHLLELERMYIESVTVPLGCSERRAGCLTAAHEERAMRCLQEFGVCILPGLLEPAAVISRGAKALQVGRGVGGAELESDLPSFSPSQNAGPGRRRGGDQTEGGLRPV